jgi:hypothetical protein
MKNCDLHHSAGVSPYIDYGWVGNDHRTADIDANYQSQSIDSVDFSTRPRAAVHKGE